MESRNKETQCSTKGECGLDHIILGNSTHPHQIKCQEMQRWLFLI